MSNLSKGEELARREQSGDASAAVVPIDRIASVNPYDPKNSIRRVQGQLYYWFPCKELWAESAQGFGQLRGAVIPNATICYQNMIEHIFFIANTIGEGKYDGLESQVVTWTVVPREDDETKYAGYLVRIIYQYPMEQIIKIISAHLNHCEKQARKALKTGDRKFFSSENPPHRRFTYDAYVNMCDYYVAGPAGDRSDGFQNLDDPSNPYNPFTIFSQKRAIEKMRRSGAHEDFCTSMNYAVESAEPAPRGMDDGYDSDAGGEDRENAMVPDTTVKFPRRGERTYKLAASQLNCLRINKTYLPHVGRNTPVDLTEEFLAFSRGAGVPMDEDSDDDDEKDDDDSDVDSEAGDGAKLSKAEKRRIVEENYRRLVGSTEAEPVNTLVAWKKKVGKRMALAKTTANGDPKQLALNLREAKKDALTWLLNDIITEDETADVGDALHAIAKWKNEHLTHYKNFCMPNPKGSKNLTRYGDFQAQEAAVLESTWAINTAHTEIKSLRLSSMHTYFYSPFHVHACCAGPPAGGKSNAMTINQRRMYPGTYRDVGVESSKSKNIPGKKLDLSVEGYEDINPTSLGISQHSSSKAGVTGNTDEEARLKYRLTKGQIKGVYKAVVDGKHMMVEVDSYCNTVMIVAMNALISSVPKSISCRFNNIQFQQKNRVGFSGQEACMFQKHELAEDKKLDPVKKSLLRKDYRNQFLHCVSELMCWGGAFERPDQRGAVLIWSNALNKGKNMGLQDTSDTRHFERLKMHCETTVIEDAIDRVFDSELSPLDPDEEFKPDDILEMEKHLICFTEHIGFTLGMFEHQYESPITQAVERWLNRKLLKHLIAKGPAGVGRKGTNAAANAEYQYYYIHKFDNSLNATTSNYDKERGLQQYELIKKLARQAHSQMHPKPGFEEVVHAFDTLANLNLTVAVKGKPNEKCSIPALAFTSEGDLMVAEHLMSQYQKARLKTCLKETLCHYKTNPKNILYGRTKDQCPYVWQTMKIVPNPDHKLKMECSSFFSAPVIKLTFNAVRGINRSVRRAPPVDELQMEDVYKEAFDSLFSGSSHVNVDMDLDERLAAERYQKLGLKYLYAAPPKDAPNWNVSPESFTRGVLAALDTDEYDELEVYPTNIPDLAPRTCELNIKKDERENPKKYSMLAMCPPEFGIIGVKRKRQEDPMDEDDGEERKEYIPRERPVQLPPSELKDDQENLYDASNFCSDGDVSDDDQEEEDGASVLHGGEDRQNAGASAAAAASSSNAHQDYDRWDMLNDDEIYLAENMGVLSTR